MQKRIFLIHLNTQGSITNISHDPKIPFLVLVYNTEGQKISSEIWCLAYFGLVQILSSPKLEISSSKHKYNNVRN